MTKRHVTFVLQAYRAIVEDCSSSLPDLRSELERDYSRLSSAGESRGLPFFTIDLVSAGKHFDQCLANERLTPFNLPHFRPFKRSTVIPRLFRGLLLRVFTREGGLQASVCIRSVAYLRQLFSVTKKLRIECDDDRTRKAVRSFYHTDYGVRSGSLDWGADTLSVTDLGSYSFRDLISVHRGEGQLSLDLGDQVESHFPVEMADTLQFVADCSTSLLGVFDPHLWKGKHGPGAVSDLKVTRTSKYEFPYWPEKLSTVFPLADFGFANLGLWVEDCSNSLQNRFLPLEPPSKLISVPKTQKAPRLIASEPTAHQWCQQLVKSFLATRVRTMFLQNVIHFRDQTFNQELARRASITQSHWTIDLSEASDRVSCWVVERMFRRNPFLLQAFHACRTRWIVNTIDLKSPKFHKLRKFSSMGSALTFPVQSIIFSIIALASVLYVRRWDLSIESLEAAAREVLVFGDDILVPKDVGSVTLGVLSSLGFQVNRSKTFGTGRFRESCGGEYFDGHDVTPNYLLTLPSRSKPESIASAVHTHNNFYRRGYYRLAAWLKSTVLQEFKLKLPEVPIGSGTFGWEALSGYSYEGLLRRFSKDYQVRLARYHSLSAKVTYSSDRITSRLLQYFTEAPDPDCIWKSGVVSRPKLNLKLRWGHIAR
ncbi:MAG: putative replicase protein [Alehxovirus nemorisvivens]|uniref:RNA-directed RNA polymerase n=1 Tax=Leviviridae sp. TaxID=2027243 RepID=A0ABY3STC7_9VIRU|nr:MAG: putative replicase protein [Leviviridae sp.]